MVFFVCFCLFILWNGYKTLFMVFFICHILDSLVNVFSYLKKKKASLKIGTLNALGTKKKKSRLHDIQQWWTFSAFFAVTQGLFLVLEQTGSLLFCSIIFLTLLSWKQDRSYFITPELGAGSAQSLTLLSSTSLKVGSIP